MLPSKKITGSCLCLLLLAQALFAQSGDWYTYSTGTAPICHIKIEDDKVLIERMDPAFRQYTLQGHAASEDAVEKLEVRKYNANNRLYLFFMSFDDLYFCTTLQYFKKQDSMVMFCANGADDGYKRAADAMNAIKKDTGTHFVITLYRKARLESQRSKQSVSKISKDEFSQALQHFNQAMDEFWQYRGYGRYEPYHSWMNLIYGNAFANAFDRKYNKLSLDAKNIKALIAQYGADTTVHKLLQEAGLIEQ